MKTAEDSAEKSMILLDIGTHATRIARIERGSISIIASRSTPLIAIDHLHIVQDAMHIAQVSKTLLAEACDARVPSQLAIAVQRSTVVAWSRSQLQALHPALSWQDTRGAENIIKFSDQTQRVKSLTGLVLSPHYGATKIAWLEKECNPQQASHQDLCIGPLAAFIAAQLLVNSPSLVDESNAARTQLFDIHKGEWSLELCKLFGVNPGVLPEVKPICYSYGKVKDLPCELAILCGDQNAAFNGLKHFAELSGLKHSALVNLGSGAFAMASCSNQESYLNEYPLLKSLYSSNGYQKNFYCEGTINSAGIAIDKLCKTWCLEHRSQENIFFEKLECWLKELSQVPLYINTDGGVGSPFWIKGQPSYFIEANNHTEEGSDEARAVAIIESIVFLLALNIKLLPKPIDNIYVSGGLAKCHGLVQKLATLTRLPTVVAEESETTLVGLAVLAGHAIKSSGKPKKIIAKSDPEMKKRYSIFVAIMNKLSGCNYQE